MKKELFFTGMAAFLPPFMKRMAWLAAALAVALAVAGCSSGDEPGETGVLGQVAGVVYDSVTGEPVKDAVVTIAGYPSVKTDEFGTYIVKNVKPGQYFLTIASDGFSVYSKEVAVDANAYKEADPYLEVETLREQFKFFSDWVTHSDIPAYEQEGLTNGTWTYSDGVFVSGDGATQITVEENAGAPQWKLAHEKLDYTWKYGIRVDIVTLTPLTGGIRGKLEVVFEVHNETRLTNGPVAVKAGVELYFVDNAAWNVSDNADVTRKYGPYTTNEDGSFEAGGLPANTEFTIEIAPFAQQKETGGVEYYFTGGEFYAHDDLTTPVTGIFTSSVGYSVDADGETVEGYGDIGSLVLFTVGNVAYITAANVPNADAPFAVSGATSDSITLTFNKAVAAGSFSASLKLNEENEGIATTSATQALKAVWSADKKTVTLTAAEMLQAYSRVSLPYSGTAGKPVAELLLTGNAEDGSPIYQLADAFEVYTEESLKLVGVEFIAAASSPARAAVEAGGSVLLTFNKALDTTYPGTAFTANGVQAPYKFHAENDKAVYVFIDKELNAATVTFSVAAAGGDVSDALLNKTFGDTLTTYGLTLLSTNLYTDYDGVVQTPSATGIFPVTATNGSPITLDFTFESIPASAKVIAELREGASTGPLVGVTTAIAADNKKLSITPSRKLSRNRQYWLKLEIRSADQRVTYYTNPTTGGVQGAVFIANNLISFTTAQNAKESVLVSANLYKDGNAALNYNQAYFPLDGDITLTFDNIPSTARIEGTKILSHSGNKVSAYARIDGNAVKITPNAKLSSDEDYAVAFQLYDGDAVIWSVPSMDGLYGPIYVDSSAITFTAAEAFAIVDADSAGNLSSTGNASFSIVDDVIIEFNKPISQIQKAQVYYSTYGLTAQIVPATTDAAVTALITAGNLSADKTILTIKTTHLLAPSASFNVRLNIVSEDGQTVVYDSTNNGDPTNWANGSGSHTDIAFTTKADAIQSDGKPAFALDNASLTLVTATPVSASATTVNLSFRPPSVNFQQNYTLLRGLQGVWTSINSSVNVNAGVTTAVALNTVQLSGAASHTDGENIQFKVRGVNFNGYVTESNVYTIDFAE